MPFSEVYKVLVVADEIATRTPMRRHGAAILARHGRFPGFANEIQGVYPQQVDGRRKLFTCVIREQESSRCLQPAVG